MSEIKGDRQNETADRMLVWDIIRAAWDGPTLGEVLAKGYEPFAVTTGRASESIWLRKKVAPR